MNLLDLKPLIIAPNLRIAKLACILIGLLMIVNAAIYLMGVLPPTEDEHMSYNTLILLVLEVISLLFLHQYLSNFNNKVAQALIVTIIVVVITILIFTLTDIASYNYFLSLLNNNLPYLAIFCYLTLSIVLIIIKNDNIGGLRLVAIALMTSLLSKAILLTPLLSESSIAYTIQTVPYMATLFIPIALWILYTKAEKYNQSIMDGEQEELMNTKQRERIIEDF